MNDDPNAVRITTLTVDIEPGVNVRTLRTKALKFYATDDKPTVPSRYVLELAHTLRLNLADEDTVRRVRDALDELLQMPAPSDVDVVIERPTPTEEKPTDA